MAATKTVVKITGIGAAKQNALKFLNNTVKDTEFLNDIGQFTADQIRNRVRGKQDEYKQNPIKNVTIEARKFYSDFYIVNELSKPKTSNLTLTGQLLDAIKFKINSTTADIFIFLSENRRNRKIPDSIIKEKYNEIIDKDHNATNSKRKNSKDKDKLTALFLLKNQKDESNKEIKDKLESMGRKFLFISERLKAQLESRIAQELRRKLALYNKIRRKLSL